MKQKKCIIFTALMLLFSALSVLACRIAPFPVNNVMYPIETRRHDVNISIKNQTADITVNATFFNPNNVQLEGDYWFPLYEDSAVSSFTMIINGKEMKADLLDSTRARQVYEEIVRRVKDPALLEYAGTRMLRQRVFPILPRSEVSLVLKYTQQLKQTGGTVKLVYPLSSAKPDKGNIGRVSIKATIEDRNGIKNVYSPGFNLNTDDKDNRSTKVSFKAENYFPDRPFTLYYTAEKGDFNSSLITHKTYGEDGYFTLILSPSLETSGKTMAKDIVFVIDHSGSMQGEKLDKAKEALRFCLGTLKPEDRFNIVTFASGVDSMSSSLKNADNDELHRARDFASDIESDGGTDINSAMQRALSMFKKNNDRLNVVIFLTDGQPTEGETDVARILRNVNSENKADARIFVFGAGSDVNTELLDKMSADNGGDCEYVINTSDSIEKSISALASRISSPVLSDIRVSVDGVHVYDMLPKKLPDMFKGSTINIIGRFSGSGSAKIILTGKAQGETREFKFSADFDENDYDESVMKLWAAKKVAYLMDEINLHGRNSETEEQIKKLGLKYGIVTPYTSFLIVEDSMRNMLTGGRDEESMAYDMAQSKSGDFAVQRSAGLAKAKKAESAPSVMMMPAAAPASEYQQREMEDKIQRSVITAGGRAFALDDEGYYVDTEYKKSDKVTKIRYLSDEYFEISSKNTDLGKILSLGQKVIFKYKGEFYKIVD